MGDVKITKRGTRLTRDQVDALAREAEAGYDLSTAKRQRVGRPALDGGPGESPRISYRVEPDLFRRTKAMATAQGRTVSDLAREALERLVG